MGLWFRFFLVFVAVLLVFVILHISVKEEREHARREKDRLKKARERIWQQTQLNRIILEQLTRRYNRVLYFGYSGLLIGFGALSFGVSRYFGHELDFGHIVYGSLIVSIMLFIVTLFSGKKPKGFKDLMEEFEPYVRGKVFKNNTELEDEIEQGEKDISLIDQRIVQLDQIISFC